MSAFSVRFDLNGLAEISSSWVTILVDGQFFRKKVSGVRNVQSAANSAHIRVLHFLWLDRNGLGRRRRSRSYGIAREQAEAGHRS